MARKAIRLARETAAKKGGDDRAAHVGFYLIDKGLPAARTNGSDARITQ